MGKVIIDLTMSLDGFIAGPDDGLKNGLGKRDAQHLHDWLFNGQALRATNFFKPKPANRPILNHMLKNTGAMIFGRKTYDITNGWNGSHPVGSLPIFILTHKPPAKVPEGSSTFVFIKNGIRSAVQQAKKAAGKKEVLIQGGTVAQQALKAGLVDEIYLHIANRILGKGVTLFENMGNYYGSLRRLNCTPTEDVLHVRYAVR